MTRLRDVEIKHLIALEAVAEERTFGKAAVRLGYTQSAVSQQIAGLERILGAPVFDRPGGPRPVELTPLGDLLLEHARDVLRRVDATGDDVERFLRGESGRLLVGTFQSITTSILPTIVGRMRDETPDVDIRLVESNDKEIFPGALARGEMDVAFTLDSGWPDIETEILFDDPYLVVTELDDGRAGPFPTRELVGRGLVGFQLSSCQKDIETGLRGVVDADLDWVFRTNDNMAVVALVRAGMGAAVVPRLAVDVRDPTVAVHEMDPPIPPRRVGLSWKAGRTLSPVAQRFLEIAREVSASHVEAPLSLTV
ncbi:LysR family transcriptional regulator [Iamia sp. SCSIO 61187]|uniref:LysR family transcriptional regulator n=1 Tax=Iamia sp. SCSIO 61187 TaxID=2722752 RepID=UPI001C63B3F0|nr:LysR family transcriptional regulator [Iamia sp. SCSIO 61187]QYG95045.1 LysR family transcriptional regulator [Iamia sp. SCSIO 61187]